VGPWCHGWDWARGLMVAQDVGPWCHGWDWARGLMVAQDMGPWCHRWDWAWGLVVALALGPPDGPGRRCWCPWHRGRARTRLLGPPEDAGPRRSPRLLLPGLLPGADLAEDAVHPGEKVPHGADEADLLGDAGDVEPALLARRQQLLPRPQHLLLPPGDGLGVVPGVEGPQLRCALLELPDLGDQHLHVVLEGTQRPLQGAG